jgi:hypothetical protein
MLMRRAEDGVGTAEALRAHMYRQWPTKESRKQRTFLVQGKRSDVFERPDGCQVQGEDLQQHSGWPWRHSPQIPGVRYAWRRATSSTYGAATILMVNEPNTDQFYLMYIETAISAPQLIRTWKRPS